MLEDVGGDFDEEGIEGASVPLGEDLANFLSLETEEAFHEVVGLTDHLHVAILDAVVNHFDVVAGTIFTDVGGAADAAFDGLAGSGAFEGLAGLFVDLGRDGFPDRGDFLEGGLVAARHEGRTEAGTFFTAGYTGTDKAKVLCLEVFFATDGVGPESVAAVDNDVILIEQGNETVDDGVGRAAGLHQDDDLAR